MNANQVEILIVDDLPDNLDLLRRVLETADFSVRLATSGQTALQTAQAQPPDLILLDIAMPVMDGFETCRRLKADPATQDIPVIFLTGQGETEKVIQGFELGAVDYVTKPFSPREVVARVGAILRRAKQPAAGASGEAVPATLQHGMLRIDSDGFKAYWGELEITLTVTEFNILTTLVRRPIKVFSRDELMEGAYEDSRYVSDRTIDSHVRRIRKKFMTQGGDPIETRRGVGYILTACA